MSVTENSVLESFFSVIDEDSPCGFYQRWTSYDDQLQSIDINPAAIIEIKPDDSDDGETYQLTEENGHLLDSHCYNNFSDGTQMHCVDDFTEINFENNSEFCTSINVQTHNPVNDHNGKVDIHRFMELCDELEFAVVSIDQNGDVQPVDYEPSEWQELLMNFSNDPLATEHEDFDSVCDSRKDSNIEILSEKQPDRFNRGFSPIYEACTGLGKIYNIGDDSNDEGKTEVEDPHSSEANVWCSSHYLPDQIITVKALPNTSVASTGTVKAGAGELSVAPSCCAVGFDFSDTDLSDHPIDVINLSDDDIEVADHSDVDVDVEMFSDDGEQDASTRLTALPLNPQSRSDGKNGNAGSFFETFGVDSPSELLRVINYFHNYSQPPQQQRYCRVSSWQQQQQPLRTAGRRNTISPKRPATGGVTNRRGVVSTVRVAAVEKMRGIFVTGRRRRKGGQRSSYISKLYNGSTRAAAVAVTDDDDDDDNDEDDEFGDYGRHPSKNAAVHNAKERLRRQELASLFGSLMKELPKTDIASRRPCMSKIRLLQAARKYIVVLEKNYLEKRQKLCGEMEDMQRLISKGDSLHRRQTNNDCSNKLLLRTLTDARCMFSSYLRKV